MIDMLAWSSMASRSILPGVGVMAPRDLWVARAPPLAGKDFGGSAPSRGRVSDIGEHVPDAIIV